MDRFAGFPHNGRVSHQSLFLLLLCAGLTLTVPPLSAKSKHPTTGLLDREYVAALASANRFLAAWQAQDHEAGIILLTDAAKRQVSEEHLQAFFAPGSAVQQGYEISRGKKLKGPEKTLFSGEFWVGEQALRCGLVDRLGDLRNVLRERYGKKVVMPLIAPPSGWFAKKLPGVTIAEGDWAASLISAFETRALWARYGL